MTTKLEVQRVVEMLRNFIKIFAYRAGMGQCSMQKGVCMGENNLPEGVGRRDQDSSQECRAQIKLVIKFHFARWAMHYLVSLIKNGSLYTKNVLPYTTHS